MESSSKHVEASSELDVPPRSWARITAAAETMAAELFPNHTVALRLLDDSGIRGLNAAFRGVDAATDVLSFPAGEMEANGPSRVHAGDLALSWQTARRQARANGNSPEEESIALVAHGLLHLAGYDHDSDAAEQQMERRCSELLSLCGLRLKAYGH